jgi:hypothetical protein
MTCICDPLDAGTAAQQVAMCVASDCALHSVRPITATLIPVRLLEASQIAPEQLDARARALVRLDRLAPGSGQNGPLLSTEVDSEGQQLGHPYLTNSESPWDEGR